MMSQLPSDSDYVTHPTDRRKCGAEFHLVVKVRAPYLLPLRDTIREAGTGSGAKCSVRVPCNALHRPGLDIRSVVGGSASTQSVSGPVLCVTAILS
jgi:hypothetical protein